ncbi:MAG: metallophosphatase [Bacteroidota bacterium]
MGDYKLKNRRAVIKSSVYGGIGIIGLSNFSLLDIPDEDKISLSILHTNDIHSHIDPFDENHSRYPGQGGLSRVASLVKRIRTEKEHTLLFDAGDIFQGTPYFNFFEGEIEFKMMSEIGYDAATMGNHDFDNAIEGFDAMLKHANFPFLCSNYDFSNTILDGKTAKYKVFQKGELKIGVFGLGIELEGLVSRAMFKETMYLDPIFQANKYAHILKNELDCDLVVCLSHLGFSYKGNKLSDKVLASQTANIDLILGGHTHTFMDEPYQQKNINNEPVFIHQVGWAGLKLGRLNFSFEKVKKSKKARKKLYHSQNQ